MATWQRWEPRQPSKVIQMHREPLQANIVLGFDVPAQRREAAEQALKDALSLAMAAVLTGLENDLKRLGVTFADGRVDWD